MNLRGTIGFWETLPPELGLMNGDLEVTQSGYL